MMMMMRPTRWLSALGLAIFAGAAGADGLPVHDDYDAFWLSQPGRAFTLADERPLDPPQSFEGQSFRASGAPTVAGARLPAGQHRIEWLGPDLTIDHHAFPFAGAKVFPGEAPAEVGDDARLFVGQRDVCVQGTPPSASGSSQRHVHVAVVLDAFTPRARRYDLPSLFGSCLALARDGRAGLEFLAGAYHVPAGAETSDGVDFKRWQLRDGKFTPLAAPPLRIRFPDPQDAYRFTVVAP